MKLSEFLISASNQEIGTSLAATYDSIVEHYVLRKWKQVGLDAGHFVEAARRFLELKLFGVATPVAKGLSNFNEATLKSYLNASGDEAYRVLVPRTLWSLYALRNKRSIGHLGAVPASEIDATLLLNGAKWVLSEIARLESKLSVIETRDLVTSIISRQQPAIWIEGGNVRILDNSLGAREKSLVALAFIGKMSESELRNIVRYKNPTNFRKILKRLDEKNSISYSEAECVISPTGLQEAECLLGSTLH
jgi:hypothetical protein